MGKSSILEFVSYLLRPWCNRLNPSQGKAFNTLSDDLIRYGESDMALEISVLSGQKIYQLNRKHHRSVPGKRGNSTIIQNAYISLTNDIRSSVDSGDGLPIIVSYGTNRSVLQIPLRIRAKHVFTQYTALERAVENAIDFKTFFEWFRDQEDIENEYIRDHGDNTYRDRALECVRSAVEGMLENVSGLRIKRSPLRMVVDKDGEELAVDYLSDGEKCTLALFGDLARRLAIANPDVDDPLTGEGIVLIDEIELHMHPSWQRRILSVLKNTFPNVQFVITTHSPQVLGELNDAYLIYHIKRSGDEQQISSVHRMDGLDSNYILECYMGTASVNQDFSQKVKNAYQLIDEGNFEEAEKEITEITAITDQNHAEVIRLECALQRGKYLYEKHH